METYEDKKFSVITPDLIFDYFEPLFKKEPYSSELYKTYQLTSMILAKLDAATIECKIVKALSLIYTIEQFEKLAPTRDELVGIYSIDYAVEDVERAIDNLIEKEYVIYLKRSNNYLRLKQTSGVDIRQKISDMIATQSGKTSLKDTLNKANFDGYIYPSRYNDQKEMTRYFSFVFIGEDEVSVTVSFSESSRSQEVADIHHLLQKFWNNNHSIVLFKNKNHFVFSFADDTKSHILSDWFEISDDYDDVVECFAIENISLHSCDEYFDDFIYAIAREYYVHPISLEEASYGMIPIDMMVPKPVTEGSYIYDDEITKEDIKTAIRDNLSYYENMYGYDYVAVRYEGKDDAVSYRNITDEIERISFELELIGENEEQFMQDMEFTDDLDEEYDDLDEIEDDEDIDPAIYEDPILMVKWLERRQKIADEEKRGIADNKRVEAE